MKKVFIVCVILQIILTACGISQEVVDDKPVDVQPAEEDIVVYTPVDGEVVGCSFNIEGKARGFWFFEGVFPARLVDNNGDLILAESISSDGNWMTEDFVDFNATFNFETDAPSGTLILHNDNPSGLSENDDQILIPLQFRPCVQNVDLKQKKIEDYIRENISNIGVSPPVLGGSWYVVSIDFPGNMVVTVIYEDGHIQKKITASYSIVDNEVVLDNLVESDM